MTLLVRDEVDIVEPWLAFHLAAGADFVIATDNRSGDGTTRRRVGHAHGAPCSDGLRGRLGDQLGCG